MRTYIQLTLISLAIFSWPHMLQAQAPATAANPGAPDMIFYNSKVVSMDDAGFTSSPGTLAQAIAVRDDEILALGSNEQIRALAGPQTRQIDLKGRMIMPSFILTHGHPTDRAW